jgi:hypothetical protein
MFSSLIFTLFLTIVSFCGFAFLRAILDEKRVFVLVPISLLLGVNAFNFLVNVLSYFIPIRQSVWIVLAVMFIASITALFIKRERLKTPLEWIFTKKQYVLLFSVAVIISLLSGIVALKSRLP